mgnify:CR=1 FL=1
MTVSIHAPARGATPFILFGIVLAYVSIHAPARGATRYRIKEVNREVFQSTHPRGVRHYPYF